MADYQPFYSASHALVIGINSYCDPRFVPLGQAEDDAQAVAAALAEPPYEFHIQVLLGQYATKQAIQQALFELRRTADDDRILVYFAGHGYTLTNRFGAETGYLAAADTIPEQDFTALELAEVTNLRLHAGAKHIAFIFDACFSGQALGLTRAPAVAEDKFLLRRAYQVISAGAGDQTVADVRSMTDLMLAALRGEAGIEISPLTISRLGLHLQQAMAADSGYTQIPQFGHLQGSQGGEFVFNPGSPRLITEGLGGALHSAHWAVRLGAVGALAEMLRSEYSEQAVYARGWLLRLADDDDERIAQAARTALDAAPIPIEPTRPAPDAAPAEPLPEAVAPEPPPRTIEDAYGPDAEETKSLNAPPAAAFKPALKPAPPPALARPPGLVGKPAAFEPIRPPPVQAAPRRGLPPGLLPVIGWAGGWLTVAALGGVLLDEVGLDHGDKLAAAVGNLIGGALTGWALALGRRGRAWLIPVLGIAMGLINWLGLEAGRRIAGAYGEEIASSFESATGIPVADFAALWLGSLLAFPLIGLLGGLLCGLLIQLVQPRPRLDRLFLVASLWALIWLAGSLLVVAAYTAGLGLAGPSVGGALVGWLGGGLLIRQASPSGVGVRRGVPRAG